MQPIDPHVITENLAAVFKHIRQQKGLTHQAVADRAGVHRSTVSLIESGKIVPTILVCIKLAQALDTDVKDLLRHAEKR